MMNVFSGVGVLSSDPRICKTTMNKEFARFHGSRVKPFRYDLGRVETNKQTNKQSLNLCQNRFRSGLTY